MSGKPYSNNVKKFKITRHRPSDTLDPGFTIEGHKLRWINSRREEDHFGRIWVPLRKDQIEEQAVKQMEDESFGLWSGGSTIRRGDLVLAFAPIEAVNDLKKEKKELADQMAQRVLRNKQPLQGVQVYESGTQKMGRGDFET